MKPTNMKPVQNIQNTPEKKFRAGAISATVWKNTIKRDDGTLADIRTISFVKNYKDKKTDEWKTTNSFKTMDIPKAVVILNKAYEYLILNSQEELAAEIY